MLENMTPEEHQKEWSDFTEWAKRDGYWDQAGDKVGTFTNATWNGWMAHKCYGGKETAPSGSGRQREALEAFDKWEKELPKKGIITASDAFQLGVLISNARAALAAETEGGPAK